MNKAFKIIWNTARGGYVVASEMQRAHGKTSRVKTAAAFALAGALALSATVTAKTITNDSISEETTTKLIYGDGELNIETAGDLRQLAEALKTGKLDPELRVTCSTFRIAAVVQKAGAIQNSADARQEYCS